LGGEVRFTGSPECAEVSRRGDNCATSGWRNDPALTDRWTGMGVQAGHRVRVVVGVLAAALVAAMLSIAPAAGAVTRAAVPSCAAGSRQCTHHERHASTPATPNPARTAPDRHGADGLAPSSAQRPQPAPFFLATAARAVGPEHDGTAEASRGPPAGELLS